MKGRQRWLQVSAILFALLTAGQIIGLVLLAGFYCRGDRPLRDVFLAILSGLALTVVGLLITFYRPENRVGWILIVSGFGLSGGTFWDSYILCHLTEQLLLPGVDYVAWFYHRLIHWTAGVPLFTLLPFLFPTGRFLTRRWRRLCLGGLTIIGLITLVTAFAPDLRMNNGFGGAFDLDSPIQWTGLSHTVYQTLFYTQAILIMVISMGGIVSMGVRLKRATGIERQQMKWFAYYLITAISIQLLVFELPAILYGKQLETLPWFDLLRFLYYVILYIVFVGLPLVIGMTIFRYRLYDIDIIIRRTLQYAVLTGALALIYYGGVVVTQFVFRSLTGNPDSPLVTVVSTLAIAVLFNPLHHRIQDFIDRRFYRKKYDAEQALAEFAAAARDEVDMDKLTDAVLGVVEETMQPESVSLWLAHKFERKETYYNEWQIYPNPKSASEEEN